MGTKPAKVGRVAPCLLNRVRTPVFVDKSSTIVDNLSTKTQFLPLRAVFAKRSSLRGRTKVAKVGPLRARVKSAKVRPIPYA